jgi:hypothetical protein
MATLDEIPELLHDDIIGKGFEVALARQEVGLRGLRRLIISQALDISFNKFFFTSFCHI